MAALVATGVENTGMIEANLGKIALAAGNEYTVDFYGDELIQLGVNSKVTTPAQDIMRNKLKDGVKNTGELISNGVSLVVSANTAEKILDHAVNLAGDVEAKSAVQRGGDIILMGGDEGVFRVAANINAPGRLAKQKKRGKPSYWASILKWPQMLRSTLLAMRAVVIF